MVSALTAVSPAGDFLLVRSTKDCPTSAGSALSLTDRLPLEGKVRFVFAAPPMLPDGKAGQVFAVQ